MQTYLSKHWHRFSEEVWERLFDFERYGTVTVGELPDDLYIELARPVYEYEIERLKEDMKNKELEIEDNSKYMSKYDWDSFEPPAVARRQVIELLQSDIDDIEEEISELTDKQVLSDPDVAFNYLKDFYRRYEIDESFAIKLIVQWYETIRELSGKYQQFISYYLEFVQKFLAERNLRYLLVKDGDNIRLVYNPAVLFMEKVIALKEECMIDDNLKGMYSDFEEEMCELINGCSNRKAKSVLHSAFGLLEGSLKKAVQHNGTRSISYLANRNLPDNCFPSNNAKQVLLVLNDFFNSYPGLRHSSPANVATRELNGKDAVVFGGISALLSKYLLE